MPIVELAQASAVRNEDVEVEITGLVCFLAFPALIVVVAVIVSHWHYHFQTCPSLIESWAKENGFRNLDFHSFGPFPFQRVFVPESPFAGISQSSSHLVIVYRISADDHDGRHRKGRALCQGWTAWMNLQDPIIVWDPEPSPPPAAQPPTPLKKPERSLLWDRDLDG